MSKSVKCKKSFRHSGNFFWPLKKYLSFTLLPYFCLFAKKLQTRSKPNHFQIVWGFPNFFSVFNVIVFWCRRAALVVLVIGQQIQTQTKQTRSRTKTLLAIAMTKTKIKVDKSSFLGGQSEIGI